MRGRPRPPFLAADPVTNAGDDPACRILSGHRDNLEQDRQLIEKAPHQKPEWRPEPFRHSGCAGAYGVLRITGDISRLTCASLLQPGAITPVAVRFSNATGAIGRHREVLEFALRCQTPDGDWDLVGAHTPVLYLRDPHKVPDFISSRKTLPCRSPPSAAAFWGFCSRSPESVHLLTMLHADRGLPASPLHMNGYGVHACSLLNAQDDRIWARFRFRTRQGHRDATQADAGGLAGWNGVNAQGALTSAIARGQCPRWDVQVQVMTHAQAHDLSFDPFDRTKVWPHAQFRPIDIGILELNRSPDDGAAEFDALALSPSNVAPGIGPPPHSMLRARASHASGHGLFDPGPGDDDFSQARRLFRLFDHAQRERLFTNIATSMRDVHAGISESQIDLFRQVHPDFGTGVCAAVDALDPQF